MRMIRSKASILLLALGGCVHNSPANVLAPFAAGELALDPTAQATWPQNISFGNKLTATVFKKLRRDPRYRIVPTTSTLFCQSAQSVGTRGYLLTVRVLQMKGNSAVAAIVLSCGTGHGVINYEGDYLLVRRGRKWQLDKPLGGGITTGV
jgi:hypothetical protein